jgi:predicted type IV restriction endonuclease
MTDPLQTAHDRAQAAIKALADAGHRKATEHAHALDALRAEVESLRTINAGLRAENDRLEAKASFYMGPVPGADVMEALRTQNRHFRERLAALDVASSVDVG